MHTLASFWVSCASRCFIDASHPGPDESWRGPDLCRCQLAHQHWVALTAKLSVRDSDILRAVFVLTRPVLSRSVCQKCRVLLFPPLQTQSVRIRPAVYHLASTTVALSSGVRVLAHVRDSDTWSGIIFSNAYQASIFVKRVVDRTLAKAF